jgi:hypothetical protein
MLHDHSQNQNHAGNNSLFLHMCQQRAALCNCEVVYLIGLLMLVLRYVYNYSK